MGLTEMIISRGRGTSSSYRKNPEELSEELTELIYKTKKAAHRMCEIVEEMEESFSERDSERSYSRMREDERMRMGGR